MINRTNNIFVPLVLAIIFLLWIIDRHYISWESEWEMAVHTKIATETEQVYSWKGNKGRQRAIMAADDRLASTAFSSYNVICDKSKATRTFMDEMGRTVLQLRAGDNTDPRLWPTANSLRQRVERHGQLFSAVPDVYLLCANAAVGRGLFAECLEAASSGILAINTMLNFGGKMKRPGQMFSGMQLSAPGTPTYSGNEWLLEYLGKKAPLLNTRAAASQKMGDLEGAFIDSLAACALGVQMAELGYREYAPCHTKDLTVLMMILAEMSIGKPRPLFSEEKIRDLKQTLLLHEYAANVMRCRVCLKSEHLVRCAKCKGRGVWYCNKDCQRQDWAAHKLICGNAEFVHVNARSAQHAATSIQASGFFPCQTPYKYPFKDGATVLNMDFCALVKDKETGELYDCFTDSNLRILEQGK